MTVRTWQQSLETPLKTRKKRMVMIFNVLLFLKLEMYVSLYLQTKIKKISAQRGPGFLLHHHEQIDHIPIGNGLD
jgi:hypothetical protein